MSRIKRKYYFVVNNRAKILKCRGEYFFQYRNLLKMLSIKLISYDLLLSGFSDLL